MLYAALTFWLFIIIVTAWGVHSLWSGLVKPRVVNAVLLPGTLVAQLGHVLGLLITGNPVRNTELMSDDDKGDPKSEQPERQRIPILGPILVGLLPLVAGGGGLFLVAKLFGSSVLSSLSGGSAFMLPQELPTSIAAFWDLLRSLITAMEGMCSAVASSNLQNWPTLLFLYLAICLTVRMAPFEGHQRGAIGAIALAGVVIAIIGSVVGSAQDFILTSSWQILSFAMATLLTLLLGSLLITGLVRLVRIMARGDG